MTALYWVYFFLGVSGLSLVVAFYFARCVIGSDTGTPGMLKIAGAKGASCRVCATLVWPNAVTVRDACDCPASSHGTWALIWVAETKNNGAG